MIYVTELEVWLLVAQVRALVIEGLGVNPTELVSISRMRWNVGNRGTTTWRVAVMGADSHEGQRSLLPEGVDAASSSTGAK